MAYDVYVNQLQHQDAFERIAALEALQVEADESTVIDAASRLLADVDPGVREQAARVLVAVGSREAAERIVPHIASEDIKVRNLAGEVLVEIGSPAVEALAPAIDDEDHDVRKFAIDLLAQLPAESLVDRIAVCLQDEDDNVVLAAVDALGALRAYEYAPALLELYEREPLARPSVVAALGPRADLDVLERALSDEDPVVQFTAAEALAHHHGEAREVLDLLLRRIDEVDAMARPVMLDSIVKLYDAITERTVELPAVLKYYLVEMLDDPDEAYRKTAVRGLRYFLDAEVVRTLLSHAGRSDEQDVEIFKVVVGFPEVFETMLAAVEEGGLGADVAAGFLLAMLAQQHLGDAEKETLLEFLQAHFLAFDAETKMAAITLSAQHASLHALLGTAVTDPDAEISSLAAEVAQQVGIDLAGVDYSSPAS